MITIQKLIYKTYNKVIEFTEFVYMITILRVHKTNTIE